MGGCVSSMHQLCCVQLSRIRQASIQYDTVKIVREAEKRRGEGERRRIHLQIRQSRNLSLRSFSELVLRTTAKASTDGHNHGILIRVV